MARRRRTGDESADVNVTPLLDIVFIMLIFFIVTATFVYEDGFDPNLPPPNDDEEPDRPPPSLLLTVQADGRILVDDIRLIDTRSVTSVVEQFFAQEPKGVVIVSAAPDSTSGSAITVLDQARVGTPPDSRDSRVVFALQSSG